MSKTPDAPLSPALETLKARFDRFRMRQDSGEIKRPEHEPAQSAVTQPDDGGPTRSGPSR